MAPTVVEQFLSLPGSPAYSPFRLTALQDNINNALSTKGKKVTLIRSLYVHYVHYNASIGMLLEDESSQERRNLEKLLVYGDATSKLEHDEGTELLRKVVWGAQSGNTINFDERTNLLLWITPRRGTISPWSSKATSIAHVCGLEKIVERVERGVLVFLELDSGGMKVDEELGLFADLLHDRMTEVGWILLLHSEPNKVY